MPMGPFHPMDEVGNVCVKVSKIFKILGERYNFRMRW